MTNPKENTDLKPISIEARSIVNQLGDLWEVPVPIRQATNDANWEWVDSIIEKLVHQARQEAYYEGMSYGYRNHNKPELVHKFKDAVDFYAGEAKKSAAVIYELLEQAKELESKEESNA